MYFLRLAKLRPAAASAAEEAWTDFEVAGEKVQHKPRVLDIRQGELCWVVGTVYMHMPLKPNILEDISKDNWISAPRKARKYISPNGLDEVMLEDESGRIRLVGAPLETSMLATGCIIAAMGTETMNGEFEIIDLKLPDLARQPQRWEMQDSEAALTNGHSSKRRKTGDSDYRSSGKVAIISGLGITGDDADKLKLDMLVEYLLGESGGDADQVEVSEISRLIIAGNSTAHTLSEDKEDGEGKHAKKYGYDASTYNPAPTTSLDEFLSMLLPSIPITLLPGETDPANASMPQQPIHPAMLPSCRAYAALPSSPEPGWFDCATNPWEADIDGWRVLGNGGQPVNDIYKYVYGEDRIDMMEHMLRWRCGAPTAPDTLCKYRLIAVQLQLLITSSGCYPYQEEEPFVIEETPHVFFVGNQPTFDTAVIEGPSGQVVRLIAVPAFNESAELVLLDMETLEAKSVKIDLAEDI
jgi:DNA polymerase delta subunit 2